MKRLVVETLSEEYMIIDIFSELFGLGGCKYACAEKVY